MLVRGVHLRATPLEVRKINQPPGSRRLDPGPADAKPLAPAGLEPPLPGDDQGSGMTSKSFAKIRSSRNVAVNVQSARIGAVV